MARKTAGVITICLVLLLVLMACAAPVSAVTVNVDLDKTYKFNLANLSTLKTSDLGDPSVSTVEFLSTEGDNSDVQVIAQPTINHIRRIFTSTTGTFKGNTLTIVGDPDSTISYDSKKAEYRIYTKYTVPTFKVTAPGQTGNPVVLKYNESWEAGDTSSVASIVHSSDVRYLYKVDGILYEDEDGYYASPNTWDYSTSNLTYTLNTNVLDLNPFTATASRSKTVANNPARQVQTGKYYAGAIAHNEATTTTTIYALAPVIVLQEPTPIIWTDDTGSRLLPMTYTKGQSGDVTLSFGGSNHAAPTNVGYVFVNSDASYEMNVSIDTAKLAENANTRWDSLASTAPVIEILYKSIKEDMGDAYTYNLTASGKTTPESANVYSTIAITPGYGISSKQSGTSINIPAANFSSLNDGTYYVYLMGTDGDNDIVALSQGQVTVKSGATPTNPPTFSTIAPAMGYRNNSVDFTITGTNFPTAFGTSGVVVNMTKIKNTTITSTITSVTSTKITGTFAIPKDANTAGAWNVELITQDFGKNIKENAYTVKAVLAPTIGAITPTTTTQNSTYAFTITGTNFQTGDGMMTRVNFTKFAGVNLFTNEANTTITSVTATKITGTMTIGDDSPTGGWNLTVTTVDGGATAVKTNAITVNPVARPTIGGVTPTTANLNSSVNFTITGTNFQTDTGFTTADFTRFAGANQFSNKANTTITSVTATKITGTMLIGSDVPTGAWNLTVTTANGGQSLVRTNAMTVSQLKAPTVTTITPTTPWYRNATIAYTIKGANFKDGQTYVFFINKTTEQILNTTVISSMTATQIDGTIVIPATAPAGNSYSLNIYTVDSGVNYTKATPFTVQQFPKPTIGVMSPATGSKNTTINFTLAGTNFQTEDGKTTLRIYEDVMDTDLPVTIISIASNKITGSIDVTQAASSGSYLAEVTCVDGGTATKTAAFKLGFSGIPTIASLAPSSGLRNNTVDFTITGTNFQPGKTTVAFKNQTDGTALDATMNINSITTTRILGNVTIGNTAPTGFYRLDIATTDGGNVNRINAFRVDAVSAPTISSVTPTSGTKNSTVAFTLMGKNFLPGGKTLVKVIDDTSGTEFVANIISLTDAKIIGNFTIPGSVPAGKYRLEVKTTDGGTVNKYDAFTVNAAQLPMITSINPANGFQNSTTSFVLKGNYFIEGATTVRIRLTGQNPIQATLTSVNTTTILGSFDIPYNAPAGSYRLDVYTLDGGVNSRTGGFMVKTNVKPTLGILSPTTAYRNTTVAFTLKGTNLDPTGTTVRFLNQTANTTGGAVTVIEISPTIYSVTATEIVGSIDVPANANLNMWQINVSTVNGGYAQKLGALKVDTLPKPTISTYSPSTGEAGTDVAFTITGKDFLPKAGTNVTFIRVADDARYYAHVQSISSTNLNGYVTLPAAPAGQGQWNIMVVTVDGGSTWKTKVLTTF